MLNSAKCPVTTPCRSNVSPFKKRRASREYIAMSTFAGDGLRSEALKPRQGRVCSGLPPDHGKAERPDEIKRFSQSAPCHDKSRGQDIVSKQSPVRVSGTPESPPFPIVSLIFIQKRMNLLSRRHSFWSLLDAVLKGLQ